MATASWRLGRNAIADQTSQNVRWINVVIRQIIRITLAKGNRKLFAGTVNDHLYTTTIILASRFTFLEYNGTSEQRLPVNSGHNFGVPKIDLIKLLDSYLDE